MCHWFPTCFIAEEYGIIRSVLLDITQAFLVQKSAFTHGKMYLQAEFSRRLERAEVEWKRKLDHLEQDLNSVHKAQIRQVCRSYSLLSGQQGYVAALTELICETICERSTYKVHVLTHLYLHMLACLLVLVNFGCAHLLTITTSSGLMCWETSKAMQGVCFLLLLQCGHLHILPGH